MANTQQLSNTLHLNVKDLVCFSHLRWDFVYQRPQHLMSRFTNTFRVFFVEEPIFHDGHDHLKVSKSEENVWVVVPMLANDQSELPMIRRQKILVDQLFEDKKIKEFIGWYYTPMALKFTNHLKPCMVIYDCMDELSAFKFAPAELKIMETELFKKADLVFTGGHNLYQAKKHAHQNIHPFPSSIDKEHFIAGRKQIHTPADQKNIPPLRFGFYGVIDERFDIGLIREVAERRPEWQIVLIGPVVKINQEDLPLRDNIHYLGNKSYRELPSYLSGWDFAMIPFAKNESTKYISPTKTPEYLAAGRPVISTSIVDVVTPYADNNLVYIADTADEFIAAAENELAKTPRQRSAWLAEVDHFLNDISWDLTNQNMMNKIIACMEQKNSLIETGLKSVA